MVTWCAEKWVSIQQPKPLSPFNEHLANSLQVLSTCLVLLATTTKPLGHVPVCPTVKSIPLLQKVQAQNPQPKLLSMGNLISRTENSSVPKSTEMQAPCLARAFPPPCWRWPKRLIGCYSWKNHASRQQAGPVSSMNPWATCLLPAFAGPLPHSLGEPLPTANIPLIFLWGSFPFSLLLLVRAQEKLKNHLCHLLPSPDLLLH